MAYTGLLRLQVLLGEARFLRVLHAELRGRVLDVGELLVGERSGHLSSLACRTGVGNVPGCLRRNEARPRPRRRHLARAFGSCLGVRPRGGLRSSAPPAHRRRPAGRGCGRRRPGSRGRAGCSGRGGGGGGGRGGGGGGGRGGGAGGGGMRGGGGGGGGRPSMGSSPSFSRP